MSILTHFFSRPPEVRQFQPYAPMRTDSLLQRMDRGWDRLEAHCSTRIMKALFWAFITLILIVFWVLLYFWWTA